MNNWYNRIIQAPQPIKSAPTHNPFQIIMNAMRNPAAFVQEQFPDVPENIRNNPDAVLKYLQQTRGAQFTQQMQQVSGMNGRR